MKNRFLRFTFVVLLSGLASISMAISVYSEDGLPTDKTKKTTSSEYLSQLRNNQETAQVSMADVIKAREESQAMRNHKSVTSNFNWTSMGPNNFGGPTKAIIFDNQDASGNTLYSGSTSGGLWKSTNYGATWGKVQMDDILNVSTICQASNGTIYVGSGVSLEPASDKLAEGSTIGKGIFVSTSGDDFQLMEGTAPSQGDVNGDWAFIQKIAVDASGKLYVATSTGLKYFDGANWTFAKSEGIELTGKSCDVVFYDGAIVTAVAGNTYISLAGFADFVLKSGEEDQMLPLGEFGNIKFAISEANSNYIYASYVNTNGAMYNVYLSTDKGEIWRVVYPGGSSINDIFNGQGLRNNSIAVDPSNEKTVYVGALDVYKGYEAQPTGYYSWQQMTNGNQNPYPPNGQTQYLHFGVNSIVFHPSLAGNVVFCTDGGMGITKDNFSSLQIMNRGYATTEYFTINASKFGDVIAGSQFNGVHYILDNGAAQAEELLGFRAPSSQTGGYNHISFINPDFYVCSASDGTFWRSEDNGINIDGAINGIDVGSEFLSPFIMWESPNDPFAINEVDFIATEDYSAGDEIWVLSNSYEFPFQTTLEVDVNEGDTSSVVDLVTSKCFIAVEGEQGNNGFEGGVYMTTSMLDYTANPVWWQIGAVEGIPSAMAISRDANYVWVGTLEGRLYRLSNVSRAVDQQTADINNPACIIANTEIVLSTTQAITSIAIDAENSDQVVITLGNYGNTEYVFASAEGMGDNPIFNSIQGNLPLMPAYASSFIVNSDGFVFVGTENGLFYTDNFNASPVNWTYEDNGFGNIPIFSIKQQNVNWPTVAYPVNDNYNIYYPGATNYGAIYLGTFGAGAYVTKDFVGFEEIESFANDMDMINVYPNPAQQQISISYDSPNQGNVRLDIIDLSGKLVYYQEYQVDQGNITLDVNLYDLENGSYILRLLDGQKQYQTKLIISK
ncbi:MAG: T9SS type A sorting domain-containing protein [Bacteroidales bacterium]|nr:T9SS type A sorting domain-containing protein [Bacteroidales bacterium]